MGGCESKVRVAWHSMTVPVDGRACFFLFCHVASVGLDLFSHLSPVLIADPLLRDLIWIYFLIGADCWSSWSLLRGWSTFSLVFIAWSSSSRRTFSSVLIGILSSPCPGWSRLRCSMLIYLLIGDDLSLGDVMWWPRAFVSLWNCESLRVALESLLLFHLYCGFELWSQKLSDAFELC